MKLATDIAMNNIDLIKQHSKKGNTNYSKEAIKYIVE